jgi:hypothetical protein
MKAIIGKVVRSIFRRLGYDVVPAKRPGEGPAAGGEDAILARRARIRHSALLGERARELLRLIRPRKEPGSELRFVRVGPRMDGGYLMVDEQLSGGIAYSFGISLDVSWDAAMVERGFDVFMYDHTIDGLPHQSAGFHWQRIGIAAEDQDGLLSLATVLKSNGHSDRKNLILKMDVEGAEWDVVPSLSDETMSCFSQVVIEFHGLDNVDDVANYQRMRKALLRILRDFVPVHVHGNNHSDQEVVGGLAISPVMEVTYLRRRSHAKPEPLGPVAGWANYPDWADHDLSALFALDPLEARIVGPSPD